MMREGLREHKRSQFHFFGQGDLKMRRFLLIFKLPCIIRLTSVSTDGRRWCGLSNGGIVPRLTSLQWEAVYEGALRVFRAETIESFAQESLGCLASLIPSKQYMLFTFTKHVPGSIDFGPVYTYGSTVHFLQDFLDGDYVDEDWIFNRMNMAAADRAFRDSDIIAEEELVKMGVYQDIYRRDGVHYGMRISMMADNALVGSYSIFRSKEAGDFSDQELEICDKLASLFSIRYKQLMRYEQIRREENGLTRVIAIERYGLSAREFQVAEKVALGCSDEEVAEALNVSVSTVRKHLYNAFAKLAVNKRSQLEELFGHR